MFNESAMRRASGVLYRALDELPGTEALTDLDVEPLARTVAFVARIAKNPFELATARFRSQRIPYTVAASAALASEIRLQLGEDDIQPLLDLPARLAGQLGTLVFPIESSVIAVVGVLFERAGLLFLSNSLAHRKLTECARAFGTILALAARNEMSNAAFVATFSTSKTVGPKATFATNFAGHLLVPTRGLAITLRKIREILKVKKAELGDVEMLYAARVFGVGFDDLARRCEREQLLPPGGARALEKFLVERFGGTEKRANELGLPARPPIEFPPIPAVLSSMLARHIDAGDLSCEDAAYWLNLSPALLESVISTQDSSERFWQ